MSNQIKIVVDPGHGGKDSGALSPNKHRESHLALKVAKLYARWLSRIPEVRVWLTREDDKFIELSDRAKFANELQADFFLSIHLNSAKWPAQGFEAFTSHGHTQSDVAVNYLLDEYKDMFPDLINRGAKEASFTVLTQTSMPAVLFELEFMHTVQGQAFIINPKNQESMALALALGTLKFCEIEGPFEPVNGQLIQRKKTQPPTSLDDSILRVKDLTLSDLEQLGVDVVNELAIRVERVTIT